MPTDTARNRILDAALSCFADKGYEATTITDIERAAGLSAGSGATYRHFDSKQEMLEASIDLLRKRSAEFMTAERGSAIESAQAAIELGRRNADLFRLLFRDLAQFPELRQQVFEDIDANVYQGVAQRVSDLLPGYDAEAVAVVLCHSTLAFTVLEAVLGVAPLGVDADRFAAAWAEVVNVVIADAQAAT